MAMHQVVANQLLADDPPETWQTVGQVLLMHQSLLTNSHCADGDCRSTAGSTAAHRCSMLSAAPMSASWTGGLARRIGGAIREVQCGPPCNRRFRGYCGC